MVRVSCDPLLYLVGNPCQEPLSLDHFQDGLNRLQFGHFVEDGDDQQLRLLVGQGGRVKGHEDLEEVLLLAHTPVQLVSQAFVDHRQDPMALVQELSLRVPNLTSLACKYEIKT